MFAIPDRSKATVDTCIAGMLSATLRLFWGSAPWSGFSFGSELRKVCCCGLGIESLGQVTVLKLLQT